MKYFNIPMLLGNHSRIKKDVPIDPFYRIGNLIFTFNFYLKS